jgi:hypothetical protein
MPHWLDLAIDLRTRDSSWAALGEIATELEHGRHIP